MVNWPYVTGGLGIIFRYASAWIKQESQFDDKELINFNRQQQINRMSLGLLGKQ